jgi:glucokinase
MAGFRCEQAVIGLEIADSGTQISTYMETSRDGSRRRRRRLSAPPTPEEWLPLCCDLLWRTIYDLASGEDVPDDSGLPPLRLGVAFWGELDRDTGTVRRLRQNPNWDGFPLQAALMARFGPGIALETAVNAAAWGEAKAGEEGTLLYAHVGREVAAATLQDGRLLVRHGAAEEQFGHVRVAPSGPRCSCGGYGHLTPIASAGSLVRDMIGRSADDEESHRAVLEITSGRAEALTAVQVVELAATGNAIAADIVSTAADVLALALANAALLLSPRTIVIGGPLTGSGEAFLGPLRTRLASILASNVPMPSLRMSTFGPVASLRGAYALAILPPG